jgi:copper(I)-binding protein
MDRRNRDRSDLGVAGPPARLPSPPRSQPLPCLFIRILTMHNHLRALAAAAALFTIAAAQAQTTITDAWVRGTVAQQKATGLFGVITSAQGGRLVSASSPVAGVVEIHEMAMTGTTMTMRPVAGGLALPAGQAVVFKPGGYHVMLLDLKAPLTEGETVSITLTFEDAGTVVVEAPVRAS